ncbi:MAG: LysM peptidoglycan-binding domain-containing protein [Bacteroidales bacterium]|jgi:membrane-bound lytic murein transglycosylase D|nr:LysM peptidoglycan-binding domain-containing protein [Bacteroidales bacterium]MBP9979282.1 LysM peptidoglycan-binding domain-containing protein [Bacteroidales bacterium]
MKIKHRLKSIAISALLTSSLLLSPLQSEAQWFKKKRPSRESMEQEIETLRFRVDSLKREIEQNSIPFSDTLSENDTINPGGLSFFETEDLLDPSANTDSLLNLWYVQRSLTLDEGISVNLETENLTSDTPDSILIKRLKAINSFIPLPYNNIIKNHIIYYTQRIPNKIDLILGLSSYYLPIFEEIFDQYDMPKELKAMAIIESALNPVATSRVNARGIWQFMYRTARQYNLEINTYVDERLDPVASSHAAAKYLKDAYTIFGDWSLAIASYNCGAGNVNKAIRRAGGSRDFWTIYPYLPRETRGYVPSFVAALYTLAYYKDHGITPRAIAMPAHVDTFEIRRPLHFGQISELIGITKEEIADLNPQYVKEIIPGTENKTYLLKLPFNYTAQFVDHEKEIYSFKDSVFFNPIVLNDAKSVQTQSTTYHTVRRGETLGRIAQRYGVRLSDLQRWNGVKSNIRVGQRLTIHKNGTPASTSKVSSAASTEKSTSKAGEYLMYTVKKGDTLWEISRKFEGVSLNDIMKLNGFTKKSKIMPGKKIKIKPL